MEMTLTTAFVLGFIELVIILSLLGMSLLVSKRLTSQQQSFEIKYLTEFISGR